MPVLLLLKLTVPLGVSVPNVSVTVAVQVLVVRVGALTVPGEQLTTVDVLCPVTVSDVVPLLPLWPPVPVRSPGYAAVTV